MADSNLNCSFNDIYNYIERKNVYLTEQDKQDLNTIFQECDTVDDSKPEHSGSDGVLNNTELAKFIIAVKAKIPTLFITLINFCTDREWNKTLSEQSNNTATQDDNTTPEIGQQVTGFSDEYDSLILKFAKKHELDPNLVKAIIKKESKFNPNSYNASAKNKGLMQVSSLYVKGNLYNPEKNIDEGCRILKHLLETFNGDVPKALMGYNRGEGKAKKVLAKGKNPAADPYVKTVLTYYEQLTRKS